MSWSDFPLEELKILRSFASDGSEFLGSTLLDLDFEMIHSTLL
jgi:hypothetical protein